MNLPKKKGAGVEYFARYGSIEGMQSAARKQVQESREGWETVPASVIAAGDVVLRELNSNANGRPQARLDRIRRARVELDHAVQDAQ